MVANKVNIEGNILHTRISVYDKELSELTGGKNENLHWKEMYIDLSCVYAITSYSDKGDI